MPSERKKKPGDKREPTNKLSGLPPELAKAIAANPKNANSEQLMLDLVEVWGGTRQLALDIYNEFQKAPAGGLTRQRILQMFQGLVVTETNRDSGRSEKPSDMTDDELQRIALEYANKVVHGQST